MSMSPQKQALEKFNKKKQQELKDFNDVNLLILKEEIRLNQIVGHILHLILLKNREEKNQDLIEAQALEGNPLLNNNVNVQFGSVKTERFIDILTFKELLKDFFDDIQLKLNRARSQFDFYKEHLEELKRNLKDVKNDIVDHGLEVIKNISFNEDVVIKFNMPSVDGGSQGRVLSLDKDMPIKLIQSFLNNIHEVSFYNIESYFKEKAKDFISSQLSKKFNFSEPLSKENQDFLNKIIMQDSVQDKISKVAGSAFNVLMSDRVMVDKIAQGAKLQSDVEVVGIKKSITEDCISGLEKIESHVEDVEAKLEKGATLDCGAVFDRLKGFVSSVEGRFNEAEKLMNSVMGKRDSFLSKLHELKEKNSTKNAVSAISSEVDEALLAHMVDAATSAKPKSILPVNDENSAPKPTGLRR